MAKSRTPGQWQSPRSVFFLCLLFFSLIATAWSLATPISGGPDEPAHIIKAASVVRGEFNGPTAPDGKQIVHVPAYVGYTSVQTCFAYRVNVVPTCSGQLAGDPWKTVLAETSAGRYNPTYYLLVGWPTLIVHDASAIIWVRVVSGILSSVFLALTLSLISSWRRRLLPTIGFAAAVTPMVFFINGVVNPSSLETTATQAAFTGVLSIVLFPARRLLAHRAAIVIVSACVAANMRGISPLWVAIAVLTPFLLVPRTRILVFARMRAVRVAVVTIAAGTGAAVIWTLFSNSLGAGLTPTTNLESVNGTGASPLRGFALVFAGTFDYARGIVGRFGWEDTSSPSAVYFLWSLLAGGLLLAALVTLRGRPLTLAIVLLGLTILTPALLQGIYITKGGVVWQGRYTLPIFTCLMVGVATVLAARFSRADPAIGRRLVYLVLPLWAGGNLASFAYTLKRYGVGLDGDSWKKLLLDPNWVPPGGTILLLGLATVSLILAAVFLMRFALDGRWRAGGALRMPGSDRAPDRITIDE
ncbi:DUF2142 domain-containing protein [Lacisediminihabitans sp.]|uniref:DUF2142 domain-containing protein n=1 Tax=Lacisediminihabitans sp. TaxID=2787631 RepID=UPI00374D7DF5